MPTIRVRANPRLRRVTAPPGFEPTRWCPSHLRETAASDLHAPGWTRRRAGRGFAYYDSDGALIKDDRVDRLKALVIPPAWKDVWICPWPNGHIQAVGTDAAGRRQYRYHDDWRLKRDAAKHERVLKFGRRSPRPRGRRPATPCPRAGLTGTGCSPPRVRLLDLGFFRVGGEQYARGQRHLRAGHPAPRAREVQRRAVVLRLLAKGGIQREHRADRRPDGGRGRASCCCGRDGGGEELLALPARGRQWHDVTSADINAYLKEIGGAESPPRTSAPGTATVLMAAALAVEPPPRSRTARKRAVRQAVRPGVRAARQHPGGVQAVLRRPARGRPVRARRDRSPTRWPRPPRAADDRTAQRALEAGVCSLLSA